MRVEESEPGTGEEQRIALPCPSARPRPGWHRRWWRKLRTFRRISDFPARPLLCRPRRCEAIRKVCGGVGEQLEIGANHRGMMNLCGGLSRCVARNPPRLSECSDVR